MKQALVVPGNFVVFNLIQMSRKLFALIVILGCCMELSAQTRTISGKVRSDDGSPVPNALITIKGSNTRATSKADGSYSFPFTRNTGTMVVSLSGFIPEEVYI